MRFPIYLKISSVTLVTALSIAGVLTYFSYKNSYHELEDKFGLALQQVAITAVIAISGDAHDKINKPTAYDTIEFKTIKKYLEKVKKANDLTNETLYTFRITPDKKLRFCVMLQEKTFIGDLYSPPEENQKIIEQVIKGKPARTGIYSDSHGRWISGLAPIINSDGKVTGILEADYKVDRFLVELNNKIENILFISGIVIFFGAIIGFAGSLTISRPIIKLRKVAQAIEKKDYSVRVNIASKDEVADLGRSFNSMAESIEEYATKLEQKVIERTTELNRANEEIKIILNNVHDGLFLLDKENRIGNHYSNAAIDILDNKNLENVEFLTILDRITNETTVENTKSYLNLMFKKDISENFLPDLNPLEELEAKWKNGSTTNKFLQFKFTRIIKNEEISNLLVITNDITEKIHLENQLLENEKKIQSQTGILFSILRIDPEMLVEFMKNAKQEIQNVKSILRNNKEKKINKEQIEAIFRSIHSIKGNAELLDLKPISEVSHKYEDEIAVIKNKDEIIKIDVNLLTEKLADLEQIISETHLLIKKLADFQDNFQEEKIDQNLLLLRTIEKNGSKNRSSSR